MQTFRTVWLLGNLSLDGELFLRDGKNVAFLLVYHLLMLLASLENVMLGARISRIHVESDQLVESELCGDHVSMQNFTYRNVSLKCDLFS